MNFKNLYNGIKFELAPGSAMTYINCSKESSIAKVNNKNNSEEEVDITVPIIELHCDLANDCNYSSELIYADKLNKLKQKIIDQSTDDIRNNYIMKSDDLHSSESYDVFQSSNNNKIENEGNEIHKCNLCGAVFKNKHSIEKHKRLVHDVHQFTCMFCKGSYTSKKKLLDHTVSHKGPHGYKCKTCGKVRKNYNSILLHVKTHVQKKILCNESGASFKTKLELKSHKIQHSEVRQFTCNLCELNFINSSQLREHISLHGDRPYKCDICEKEFNVQGNLTNHRKLHFEEKPYKCQFCDLSFLSNSARKKHVPIHKREKTKSYECLDCHKKYTSTTSLAVHRMKFHSGGRVFHCHYCKKKFKSKSDIAEHVMEHATERPHSCQQCLCRYKNRRELRRHQREKEHYDTQPRTDEKFSLFKSKNESLDKFKFPKESIYYDYEKEEENENDEDYWKMVEPEICIKIVDSNIDYN